MNLALQRILDKLKHCTVCGGAIQEHRDRNAKLVRWECIYCGDHGGYIVTVHRGRTIYAFASDLDVSAIARLREAQAA